MNWDYLIHRWETFCRAGDAPETTLRTRRSWLRTFARAFPDGPESVDLEGLTGWLAEQKWSSETRRCVRSTLRSFYSVLIDLDLVSENPAQKLPKVKVARGKPHPLPEEDFVHLLLNMKVEARIKLAIMLGGFCGLRIGEIAKARRDDLERDLLGWALRVVGKGGRERMVPVPDFLAEIILSQPDGWLFPSMRSFEPDRHISPAWLGKMIRRHMPAAFASHSLRHRALTKALEGTFDLRAVQELAGHVYVTTTELYTLVTDARVRAAMDAAVQASGPVAVVFSHRPLERAA